MRAYLPASWTRLAQLQDQGSLAGPLPGRAVDPDWRTAAPEVDEEEWEYEAQQLAAAALADLGGGMVLAVDLPDGAVAPSGDGQVMVTGQVAWQQVAAVLDGELAWYALQELEGLLAAR